MRADVPGPVSGYLRTQGWGELTRLESVGGGCINDGHVLTTSAGPRLFIKRNPGAPADMFAREAEGLEALGQAGGPRVPRPLLAGPDFLLLEYLPPDPPAPDCWERLGRELARLHQATQPRFGFAHDNYIGSTPQPNAWQADGHRFFAERRLLFQAELARRAGRLDVRGVRQVESIAARLPSLVPPQPPSLIHGDLWSGNVIRGPGGRACLIDPAAHYGWAEADLAMTALFGRLPDSFYQAYQEVRPLASAWRERLDLYNLYHLLNHLNLFGAGYLGQVQAVLRAFG